MSTLPLFTNRHPAANLLNGLLAYWKLDEASGSRFDSSGVGLTLGARANPLSGTGVIHSCAKFLSASTQFLSGNYTQLTPGSGDFTIAGWVQFTTIGTSPCLASRYSSVNGLREWRLNLSGSNQLVITMSKDGTSSGAVTATATNTTVVTGTWYFFAAWKQGALLSIMVNNGPAGTATLASATVLSNAPVLFLLGASDAGTTLLLNGLLDEVAIWNRALTGSERSYLYNQGQGYSFNFRP